jgi:hypothetical protein
VVAMNAPQRAATSKYDVFGPEKEETPRLASRGF